MQSSARRRRPIAILVALVLLLTAVTPAVGASPSSGFSTDRPAMLDPVADDVTVKALISVGDMVGAYRFESLPDGMAIWPRDRERVDLYVNHETSKVPFQGVTDYRNSEVSHLVVKRGNGKILSGDLVVPSSRGYQRFCSNFIAGAGGGLRRPAPADQRGGDRLRRAPGSRPGRCRRARPANRRAWSWPSTCMTGAVKSIPGMGRHNHENAVAIPGYDQAVVALWRRHVHARRARSSTCTWRRRRRRLERHRPPVGLPGCRSRRADAATENDYGDVTAGESINGRFIPCRTKSPMAGRPASRTGPTRTTSSSSSASRTSLTTATHPNVIYFADTGEPRAAYSATSGTRLGRAIAGTRGDYMNGRLWKMVLDADGPDHRDQPFDPARRRLRRRRIQQPERRPPAGQHRVGQGRHPFQEDPGSTIAATSSGLAASPTRPTPASGGTTWRPVRRA